MKINEATKKDLTQEGGHLFFCGWDTVVISVGARTSKEKMIEALDGKVNGLYTVGDLAKQVNAMISVASAYDKALKI